jgi:hypothetical protein
MRRIISFIVILALFQPSSAFAASTTVAGIHGETLTASATKVSNNSEITITGKRFDETVGIYLSFCVIPKSGKLPTPCGGGINKAGIGEASFWISSNPPPYGIGLAEPFKVGGRFTAKLKVSQKIGKFDCKKVKCAVTIRADHLRSEERSYDLYIPIKFK